MAACHEHFVRNQVDGVLYLRFHLLLRSQDAKQA